MAIKSKSLFSFSPHCLQIHHCSFLAHPNIQFEKILLTVLNFLFIFFHSWSHKDLRLEFILTVIKLCVIKLKFHRDVLADEYNNNNKNKGKRGSNNIQQTTMLMYSDNLKPRIQHISTRIDYIYTIFCFITHYYLWLIKTFVAILWIAS